MAVAVRSSALFVPADPLPSTGTATCNKPSGTVSGDVLVAFVARSPTAAATTAITAPGWAVSAFHTGTANVGPSAVLTLPAGGAEPATYTFTSVGYTGADAWSVVIVAATGVDATTPVGVAAASTDQATASASIVAPALTVPTGLPDQALLLCAFNATQYNATANTYSFTPPAGMTEQADQGGNFLNVSVDYLLVPSGSTGTKTATFKVTAGGAAQTPQNPAWATSVALRPAVTGPTPISGADPRTGADVGTFTAAVAATDPGVGADSGAISIPVTGSDAGVAAESYLISIPIAGADTGAAVEAAGSVSQVAGPDARTAVDTGTNLAAVAAPADPGVAAESVNIGVSSIGGGTVVDGGLVNAQLIPPTDTGSGADGGSYEVLAADLNLSLWAVGAGGALSPLPDFESLTLSPIRNAPGSVQVVYPADGINFALLYNNITGDRDVEVEIWLSGDSTKRLRALLQESSGDDAGEARVWTFAGGFLEQRMDEAVIFPQTGGTANAQQELVFSAATAGTVMSTLLSQAQARGALTDLTKDFTNTTDSSGVAWPNVVTTKFSPAATYLSVLDTLVGLGLCEWSITADHVLHLYGPAGLGVDRTVGAKPTILRRGRNLTSAPRKHSVRQSATAVLVAGANGLYTSQTSANAQSRRGRRIEASASANNLTDAGSVTAYAASELQVLSPGLMELTVGLGFLPGEPRPGTVFNVGDWLFVDTLGSLVRYRVAQWSLTLTSGSSVPTGVVVVNDTVTDRLSALSKRLSALTSGSAVVGTSPTPTGNSTPNPPTSVTASSTAYLDGATVKASVLAGWTAPTTNVDSTSLNDLAGFNVEFSYASSPTVWISGGSAAGAGTLSRTFVANPGVSINIRVAAYSQTGHTSGWSTTATHVTAADAAAPPAPSTPVVSNYLGVLRITWDGLTNTGADMLAAAPDFDHVAVHISAASGFTPSPATYFDTLFAAGTQVYTAGVYGTTYYAKLVAIDTTGNAGIASAQGSDAPSQVVSADLFANCVGSVQVQDAAIVNAKIGTLAVNDAQIGNLSVGKITAGTLSVAVTLSGIIRTNTTGARSEIDGAGIRLYDSGGTNTVNLKTVDGSVLVTGQYQTALSGQRLVLNPGGSVPDQVNIYPSGGGDFARIMARTAPLDGSAAVLIDGGAAVGVGRGRLGAYKSEAFISWVTNDSGGDTSAGFSQTAVSCRSTDIELLSQSTINFDKYSGSTAIAQSHLYITWVAGSGGANMPLLTANNVNVNAGIKLDSGVVLATINEGTAFATVKALSYVTTSTGDAKTGIVDIATVLPPLTTIRAAKAKAYKYKQDVTEHGDGARTRFGPIAEDLPPALVHMSPAPAGGAMEAGVSLNDQVGVLWAAVAELADTVDGLTARIPKTVGGKP